MDDVHEVQVSKMQDAFFRPLHPVIKKKPHSFIGNMAIRFRLAMTVRGGGIHIISVYNTEFNYKLVRRSRTSKENPSLLGL
jgi:hypothetical protein